MPDLLRLLGFVVVLIPALACAGLNLQATPPPDPAFVGTWQGDEVEVEIGADGEVRVERQNVTGHTAFRASARTWNPGSVEVGLGPIGTTYEIQQAPELRGDRWVMVFDGDEVHRPADP